MEGKGNKKVCLQFFYLRSEVGQGVVKTEKWREAVTNTKSAVGKAQGKEEKMLERVKSTRSQLQSSFVPAFSVPISACLKDGSVQKAQSLQKHLDLDRCPWAALLRQTLADMLRMETDTILVFQPQVNHGKT